MAKTHTHKWIVGGDQIGGAYAKCTYCGLILDEDGIEEILNHYSREHENNIVIDAEELGKILAEALMPTMESFTKDMKELTKAWGLVQSPPKENEVI
jgi:hypothetical protein